jgi:hypothetical protein
VRSLPPLADANTLPAPPSSVPTAAPTPTPLPAHRARRMYRQYKCAKLTHANHKGAYDLMINIATYRCCAVWKVADSDGCDSEKVEYCMEGAIQRFDPGTPRPAPPRRPYPNANPSLVPSLRPRPSPPPHSTRTAPAGAKVIWSTDAAEYADALMRQYMMRGDRCGCSQLQNEADRALAEDSGVNKYFEVVPSRWADAAIALAHRPSPLAPRPLSLALTPSLTSFRYAQDRFRGTHDRIAPHVSVVRSTYGRFAACVPFHVWFDFAVSDKELAERQVRPPLQCPILSPALACRPARLSACGLTALLRLARRRCG